MAGEEEEFEVKEEPPFILKVVFILVFVSLFLAYPLCICFLDPPSELPHDFLDRVVEFYGIEKSEIKAYLFYITLFLGTLCIVFFMMLMFECVYSFLFGGLIFGRTFQVKGQKVWKEIKEELVKMNKYMDRNSIVLNNIQRDDSIPRITNSPIANSPAYSHNITPLTTQASESESELTGDDETSSPKKRGRVTRSSSSSSQKLEVQKPEAQKP